MMDIKVFREKDWSRESILDEIASKTVLKVNEVDR